MVAVNRCRVTVFPRAGHTTQRGIHGGGHKQNTTGMSAHGEPSEALQQGGTSNELIERHARPSPGHTDCLKDMIHDARTQAMPWSVCTVA